MRTPLTIEFDSKYNLRTIIHLPSEIDFEDRFDECREALESRMNYLALRQDKRRRMSHLIEDKHSRNLFHILPLLRKSDHQIVSVDVTPKYGRGFLLPFRPDIITFYNEDFCIIEMERVQNLLKKSKKYKYVTRFKKILILELDSTSFDDVLFYDSKKNKIWRGQPLV